MRGVGGLGGEHAGLDSFEDGLVGEGAGFEGGRVALDHGVDLFHSFVLGVEVGGAGESEFFILGLGGFLACAVFSVFVAFSGFFLGFSPASVYCISLVEAYRE